MTAQPVPTTGVAARPLAKSEVVVRTNRPGSLGGAVWWRHALAVLALIWALFPIVFLVSASLNPAGTLSSSELLPTGASLTGATLMVSVTDRATPPSSTW